MTDKDASTDSEAPTVDIHYLKTSGFREVACDGALGGPTPHGKLWLAFYTERFPLPRVMRQKLMPSDSSDDGMTLDAAGPATVEVRSSLIDPGAVSSSSVLLAEQALRRQFGSTDPERIKVNVESLALDLSKILD
jgi:hypothetical protein